MPRDSKACYRCRQRRVKCDARRPDCVSCERQRCACPGYPPPSRKHLRFIIALDTTSQLGGAAKTYSHHEKSRSPVDPVLQSNGASDQPIQCPESFTRITERHTRRSALLGTFLEYYLPDHRDNSLSHFAFLTHLSHTNLSPLLENAIDALCLTMLGHMRSDTPCLHASRVQYLQALPVVSREVSRPFHFQTPVEHTLVTIVLLALSDLLNATGNGSDEDHIWRYHIHGAEQFLFALGPEVVATFTSLGRCMFHTLRHSLFCKALVTRTPVTLASQRWLKATEHVSSWEPCAGLYDVVVQIPSVLQQSSEVNESSVVAFCQSVYKLRAALEDWVCRWSNVWDCRDSRLVSVEELPVFATACLDRTFELVYSFPSVETCSQYQLYLVACFALDLTLQKIYRESSQALSPIRLVELTSRSEQRLTSDIYDAAVAACRTLPYCFEPHTMSVGRIGVRLLGWLDNYFATSGYGPESNWCRSVQNLLERMDDPKHALSLGALDSVKARDREVLKFWTRTDECTTATPTPRCRPVECKPAMSSTGFAQRFN